MTPEAPAAPPTFTGVISTREVRVITADFEGRIMELNLNSGQRVRAGDSIGRLDDSDLKLQLERAKASEKAFRGEVGAAGARASALAHQAKSQAILARAGAAPLAAVRNANAEAASAGASTSAASGHLGEAQVGRKQIEEMLKKADLKAPIDGVITMVSAKKGAITQKGTILARVYDTRDLTVRFLVPHDLRATIQPGSRVKLAIEGVNHDIFASVQLISDEVEPPINSVIVEADIDDSKLVPDEVRVNANTTITLADARPTTTVSTTASATASATATTTTTTTSSATTAGVLR